MRSNALSRASRPWFLFCAWLALSFAMTPLAVRAQFRDVTPRPETEVAVPRQEPPLVPEPMPVETDPADRVRADGQEGEEVKPAPAEETVPVAEEPAQPEVEIIEIDDVPSAEEIDGSKPSELRPLRFRGVVVGTTTADELAKAWGQPFKIIKSPTTRVIKYRAKSFRQIDVTVVDDEVISILIHLNDLLDPTHVANQLQLTGMEPVPVPDEFGKVLGLAYPERGVLLSFDTQDPEALISKIQLEPVNPEPFVLRAEFDFEFRFEQNLKDIDQALELNPRYARAHCLKAEKLAEIGRFHEALESASKACYYDPDNLPFQLTKARLMARNGNHDSAVRDIEALLDDADLPDELRAASEALLGDLISEGSVNKYKEALEHHLRAIQIAAPLANDRRFRARRMAKQVLIDAHLAVARDISLGEFQRQEEVVPKWLSRGRALVEEMVRRDQGDEALRLAVYRQILATAADLRSGDDPSRVVAELVDEGRRQIAAAQDPHDQARREWLLGSSLAEAVRLERLRGDENSALNLADDAIVVLQHSAKHRQSTPEQRYLVGRLYFHIGSLHAVQGSNHSEAAEWYAKAEPLLSGEIPPGVLADPGTHGEMFVSMGVSYWETGNRSKAIDLTEQGTDVLQRGVVDGILTPESLSIPYGNLATMHKKAGNVADAKAFAELASSLKDALGATKRR